MSRKMLRGQVVAKSAKTISVSIERLKKHSKYLKIVKLHNKILVHDENEVANLMDIVEIVETKPVSKRKSWMLSRVIK